MTKAKTDLGLAPFDAADYLVDDAAVAELLNAALEDANPDVFLQALRTAARAQERREIRTPVQDNRRQRMGRVPDRFWLWSRHSLLGVKPLRDACLRHSITHCLQACQSPFCRLD